MVDGILEAETSTPDLATLENDMWSELNGSDESSQGKDTEESADSEPASVDNESEPEEQPQETASPDDIQLDEEGDQEEGGVDTDTPADDQEPEGDNSREPTEEELTVQNADTRIRSAQARMHDANKEASELRGKLEAERQQREDLEAKLNSTVEAIDKGEAKTSREQRREKIMANLSEEQKENFELYGDMIELMLDIQESENKGDSSKDAASEDQSTEQERPDQERIDSWRDGVLSEAPEWFDTIDTPEWKNFADSNPKFMQQVIDRYDNLDPRGAVKMYQGFQRFQERSANTKKATPSPTARPRGRTVASSSSRGAPVVSRDALEKDMWNELGG